MPLFSILRDNKNIKKTLDITLSLLSNLLVAPRFSLS